MFDDDKDLISGCLNKEEAAENHLYRRFAPGMYAICLRYGGNEKEAREILQDGFIRLFNHLHQFRFEGSFDGWVRRIFVNTAINYYRKSLKFRKEAELPGELADATKQEDALSMMSTRELLAIIQDLPVGYRTVFNMYVIEDYQHKEIAAMLGISEGTSKSQLFRAKLLIRRVLENYEK